MNDETERDDSDKPCEETIRLWVPTHYRCPKHGDVGEATMRVWLKAHGDTAECVRMYCMRCLVEVLDQKVEQVEEITDDERGT